MHNLQIVVGTANFCIVGIENIQGVNHFFPSAAPMDTQENPEPIKCEVCGAYFESRRGLANHARIHLRQRDMPLSETSGAPIEMLHHLIQESHDSTLPLTVIKKISRQEVRTPSVQEDKSPSFKVISRAMATPPKVDQQGSPSRSKESTQLLPSSPSALRLAESSTSSRLEQQTPSKPLWAPLETDAPITLASDNNNEVHVCQLCGCWYETRKGLSSHARSHLRQIGIPDIEIKGSPIDLLYQIMEDEDLKPISNEHQEQLSTECPSRPSPKRSAELSSPATPPPSKLHRSSEACTCMLCGEEFENRKGLSSHARSHLRQIGVLDLLGKSSAIDTVQDLVSSGVLEAVHPPKMNSPTSLAPASTPPAEPPLSPSPGQSQTPIPSMSPNPVKYPPIQGTRAPKAKKGFRLAVDPLYRKPKLEPVDIDVSATGGFSSSPSTQKLPSSSDALKSFSADVKSPPTVLCDFCGQLFDTRKALSCHARAHLRQLGLTWSIRTSPIDLLKEVMMHGEEGSKGSLASSKPMWSPSGSRRSMDSQHSGRASSNPFNSPLDYSMKDKSGKSRASHTDKSCELCGFDFENRKALASHARAHLRQLGLVEWKTEGASSPIELLSELIRRDPARVAAVTRRYRMGDLYIKKRALASLSLSTDSESLPGHSSKPSSQQFDLKMGREDSDSFRKPHGHTQTMAATGNSGVHSPRGVRPPRHIVPSREDTQNTSSQHPPRSGSIPALVPRPPLTPLVKLVGKMYFLKCRFCEKVFQGPVSVQEQWITHLQKHILSLGYKGKASPPTAQVETPALVHPVAV